MFRPFGAIVAEGKTYSAAGFPFLGGSLVIGLIFRSSNISKIHTPAIIDNPLREFVVILGEYPQDISLLRVGDVVPKNVWAVPFNELSPVCIHIPGEFFALLDRALDLLGARNRRVIKAPV